MKGSGYLGERAGDVGDDCGVDLAGRSDDWPVVLQSLAKRAASTRGSTQCCAGKLERFAAAWSFVGRSTHVFTAPLTAPLAIRIREEVSRCSEYC